jgi:hypothetical protein
MPHPNWTHTCKKTGRTKSDWKPFRCWRCFGQAEFSGWSSSVVEMMGGYQREHGLKCLGPHRPLADRVFAGAFTRCDACGGSGYCDDGAHQSWALCEACDGFGRRPSVSEEDIERRRAIVLAAFPDAARPPSPRRHSSGGASAGAVTVLAQPAAPRQMTPVPNRRVVGTGTTDGAGLFMATLSVLVVAPGWFFCSLWAFRGGQVYAGAVLLFASAFAALSGLMTASPSSFDRKWLWVWGAFGLGLFLLLGLGAVQAACAGWSAAAE